MPNGEKVLIKRATSGDVKAFEQLISPYQQFAYNIALRMLYSKEDAKDVTQEAFIKVFQQLKNFNQSARFKTWFYRIVINTCHDFLRREKRHRNISTDVAIDTNEGQIVREIADDKQSLEKIAETKELQHIIHRALQTLPADNKVCVLMRDIHGMSYSEISDILNIPLGTVKSRLKRGRNMLKDAVEQDIAFSRELLV